MLKRNYSIEIYVEDLGNRTWRIHGMSGPIGIVKGLDTRQEAERHVFRQVSKKFPEMEIALVNRMPHLRGPHIHDLMREQTPKKKLHAAGCTGIARENRSE